MRVFSACALLLSTGLALAAAPAAGAEGAAPPAGDLWEVTSQMSMEGMPMALPAHKVKVCAQKEWKEPPGSADPERKCTNSDFKWSGQKATWKVMCAGPPKMTGNGELTRESPEAWSGAIHFDSSDGAMTIKLNGRLLGGCEKPR